MFKHLHVLAIYCWWTLIERSTRRAQCTIITDAGRPWKSTSSSQILQAIASQKEAALTYISLLNANWTSYMGHLRALLDLTLPDLEGPKRRFWYFESYPNLHKTVNLTKPLHICSVTSLWAVAFLLALLDYVGIAHEIEICSFSVVRIAIFSEPIKQIPI